MSLIGARGQVDGVETVQSIEQDIHTQNFPNPGVPVMLGSNLDEGSTFMCVSACNVVPG